MADSRFFRLRVAEVIAESADACSFVFDLPTQLRDAFSYRPGQFLTLLLPLGDAVLQRCYSLSSAPLIDTALKITVKRVRDGRGSNWLCDHLKAGDELDVMPPAGVFSPRSLDQDLLLFAGGSGITPLLSILKSALVSGRGALTLIYANRDERSVLFKDELRELVQRHPSRLRVVHWLDSVQGVPQQRHLEELALPWSLQECFICGPAPFMESALGAVVSLGLPRSRVHVERFVSLPDLRAGEPPTAGKPEASAQDGSCVAGACEVVTVLDGQTFHFACEPGETLLDAMLRTAVPAPNSCRSGQCGACMCRVESGTITLEGNQVLDDDELADGWTLACCARPSSAALRVVFPE